METPVRGKTMIRVYEWRDGKYVLVVEPPPRLAAAIALGRVLAREEETKP
jgi:hypothetical protein